MKNNKFILLILVLSMVIVLGYFYTFSSSRKNKYPNPTIRYEVSGNYALMYRYAHNQKIGFYVLNKKEKIDCENIISEIDNVGRLCYVTIKEHKEYLYGWVDKNSLNEVR